MTDLTGKVIWITGASSGIGEALARSASSDSTKLILSGRRVDALQSLADELSAETLVLPFEVTDYSTLADIVDQAWAWQGRVDVLVNNAGISQRCLAIDAKPEIYTELINIDLIAPIWLTQLQLSRMADAGGGHIVAISSVAGRIGAPLRTAYSAAKFGLIGYMDALRTEVDKPHDIKVTNILPGSVATDVSRNAITGDGSKRGKSDAVIDAGDDPMDCAAAIWQAVANDSPELIYAKEMELGLAQMRHADPDNFFAAIKEFGANTVDAYWQEQSEN
ncbi:MAG: short-chain dehydrogenase [Halieaceae bacterium MED-G27]|jgi:dehydrogenase/reductase SDR family protein 7B|nr:short-chain dehydrogenase [Halieaceae bacterium]OUT67139.1 MAG: short-chain dehydrogenase [Cellvibrionales bacterium TMED21]PDH36926.1 MAG: short-chain dehydrogenase [Halieaceae bacterium MED-G27]